MVQFRAPFEECQGAPTWSASIWPIETKWHAGSRTAIVILVSDLISAPVQRALNFIAVVNEGDVFPTKAAVDAFVYTEQPTSSLDQFLNPFRGARALAVASLSEVSSVAAYLTATGLAIEHGGGIKLTKSGLALWAGIDKRSLQRPSAQEVLEVVGRLEDPIVYAKLLTEIDKQERALVVDPYLPSADLLNLIELPGVERVLTRDTNVHGQKKDERRRHLAIALGARPDVELRFLSQEVKELHDRLVLPTGVGAGLMIGTSLGGTQLTVVSHLSEDTTEVLRHHYELLWSRGEKLEPVERVAAIVEPEDQTGRDEQTEG